MSIKIFSKEIIEFHPLFVNIYDHIDPPIVIWPVWNANLGEITLMNGAEKG